MPHFRSPSKRKKAGRFDDEIHTHFFLLHALADFYTDWGDYAESFRVIEKADRLIPGHHRTALERGYASMKSDKREEAARHFR